MEEIAVQVVLRVPLEKVKEPIVWRFAQDFDLVFSILRAHIAPQWGGYAVVELTGSDSRIEAALAWATAEGVLVQRVESDKAQAWIPPYGEYEI